MLSAKTIRKEDKCEGFQNKSSLLQKQHTKNQAFVEELTLLAECEMQMWFER